MKMMTKHLHTPLLMRSKRHVVDPHLKLFAILLSGNIDVNVAEISFSQMQNCMIRNTNEDDDQTFT